MKAYAFAGPTLSFGLAANEVTKSMTYSSVDGKETKYTNIERYNGYTGKYYMKTYNSGTKSYEIEKGKITLTYDDRQDGIVTFPFEEKEGYILINGSEYYKK